MNNNLPPEQDRERLNQLPQEELVEMIIRQAIAIEQLQKTVEELKLGNGSILDEVETALHFAKTMTWNGKHPVVKLVNQTYSTGVRLTKKAM